MIFFGCSVLKCVSMNNQECKIRSIIDLNSNDPTFYPYSIEVNKCSGSCSNINDPYANLLREKCPNTELFLVRIFLYSD